MSRWALLILFFASPCWAQEVKLPAEVAGDVGQFIRIPASADGPQVRWYAISPGLNVFPVELLKDSKTCVVTAAQPGRYRLIAWTAKSNVPSLAAEVVVVVGGVPPTPVPPTPVPPDPVDPFLASLRSAFAADGSATRVDDVKQLAAVYRQAQAVVDRQDVTNLGQLQSVMRQAITTLIGDRLGGVRQVIGAELRRTLPTDALAPMDAALRLKAGAEFTRIGRILEQVK